MASVDELRRYLPEHYAYELKMLRYTSAELTTERRQLAWNAFLESFAVHARILRDFYTNHAGNGNVEAADYGVTGIAKRNDQEGIFDRINRQVAHLAKSRPYVAEEKFDVKDVLSAKNWLEDKHDQFISTCDPAKKSDWKEELGIAGSAEVSVGPIPLASSHMTSITSTSLSESVVLFSDTSRNPVDDRHE